MIVIVQIFAEFKLIYEFINGFICISLGIIILFFNFKTKLHELYEPVIVKHRKTKWEIMQNEKYDFE
jgi:hypothetical protein